MRKEENKEHIDKEYLDMMSYNFNHALENELDMVYMGYSIEDDEYMKEYWVMEKDYIKTLDMLIESAVELEEYEYAKDFKILKEKYEQR